ncbi:MAG TPA: TetR/AcrR family transcriptional regulator [Candidatus Kryptobacter bacterium]|nr:TetR/AcrR family transcriptional regulator [Candidatus Kryptobacter bacterium]
MGILERKEREKLMRRETILGAAEAVFFEKGLRAATLEEIAERAEVSKGTIYLYFSTKEDLYCSLMTRGLLLLLNSFREAKPEEVAPPSALGRLSAAYLDFSRSHSHLFKMLAAAESPAVTETVSAEVFAALEDASDKVLSYVATFVQRGIDDGVFRKDLSSQEAVVLFWVSLSGLLNLKERSLAMKNGNVLNADSIIGSVDFDSLYNKCMTLLMSFLGTGESGPGDARRVSGNLRRPAKKARTVGRK